MVHNFEKSLAASKAEAKKPIWLKLAQAFFPGCTMHDYEDDLAMQMSGIDKILVLPNGKSVWVDFKHRPKRGGYKFDDILLEYWYDEARRKPGWLTKPDAKTDYVIYFNETNNTCQLIPFKAAVAAWNKYKEAWMRPPYFQCRAVNEDYITVGACIPVETLKNACQEFGGKLISIRVDDLR